MIMVVNNFSSKYWIDDEIKDCSNNYLDDEIELFIDNEKLKIYCNEPINSNYLNARSKSENLSFTSRNTIKKNTTDKVNKYKTNINESNINKYQNNSNKIINSKNTNKYNNLQRTNNEYYYKKKMYKLPSVSRISECKRRNILLATCPKPILKNLF